MLLAKMQHDIETFFFKQNQVECFEPKFQIVMNVQVSDPEFHFARRGKLPRLS